MTISSRLLSDLERASSTSVSEQMKAGVSVDERIWEERQAVAVEVRNGLIESISR